MLHSTVFLSQLAAQVGSGELTKVIWKMSTKFSSLNEEQTEEYVESSLVPLGQRLGKLMQKAPIPAVRVNFGRNKRRILNDDRRHKGWRIFRDGFARDLLGLG